MNRSKNDACKSDKVYSDEDVIILGTDDSSPDDWLPDISLEKNSPMQNSHRPAISHPSSIGLHGQASQSSTPHNRPLLTSRAGSSSKGLDTMSHNRSPLSRVSSEKSKRCQSQPRLVRPLSPPGLQRFHAAGSNPALSKSLGHNAKMICPGEGKNPSHRQKSLDCMDLFKQTPAAKPGERHIRQQPSHTPYRIDEGLQLNSLEVVTSATSHEHLAREKSGEKTREHKILDKKALPTTVSKPRFISGSSSNQRVVSLEQGKAHDSPSRGSGSAPLIMASRDRQVNRFQPAANNYLADKRKLLLSDRPSTSGHTNPRPSSSFSDNIPVSTLSSSETTKRNLSVEKLPSKHHQWDRPSPPKLPLSPPTGHYTYKPTQHFKTKHLLSPPAAGLLPKAPSVHVTSPNTPQNQMKKLEKPRDDKYDTESSSAFDFDDGDFFEVLDSVESESICSAYNQSDTESMGTGSEECCSKHTSESEQLHPSNLTQSLTCKSPSESRMLDFTRSFKKRRQLAKKSTTLNGARFFRHPLKGRGFLRLKRYCSLRLTRLHHSVVRKARQVSMEHVPTTVAVETTLAKRKREVKLGDLSNSAKRPKLLSESVSSNVTPDVSQSSAAIKPKNPAADNVKNLAPSSSATAGGKSPEVTAHAPSPVATSGEVLHQKSKQPKNVSSSEKAQSKPSTSATKSNVMPQQGISVPQVRQPVNLPSHGDNSTLYQPRRPLPLILRGSKTMNKWPQQEPSARSTDECLKQPVSSTPQSSPVEHSRAHSSGTRHSGESIAETSARPSGSEAMVGGSSEKLQVSSEPRLLVSSPVSKKCLSLKRNRLNLTHPLLDSTSLPSPVIPAKDVPQKTSTQVGPKNKVLEKLAHSVVPHTSNPCVLDTVTESVLPPPVAEAPCADNSPKQSSNDVACQTNSKAMTQQKQSVDMSRPRPGALQVVRGSKQPSASVSKTAAVDKSQQVPAVERREKSLPLCSSTDDASTKLSRRDEAYDICLLQTIAKLAPSPAEDAEVTDKRHSMASIESGDHETMEVGEEERDVINGSTSVSSNVLTVKLPISKLDRLPAVSPVVTTTALGMFRDVAVQAERGMIVDKDVLDAYLVVKLHEAMFDMKEQLQKMEAQVLSVTKQKESLERMLESKAKYIRDMTTTGIKSAMVDKGMCTDPIPLSPIYRPKRTRSYSDTTPTKPKKCHKNAATLVEKSVQTVSRMSSVSCQTEGVVRTIPARLQTPSQPYCLYNHPDSQLQLVIEKNRSDNQTSPPATGGELEEIPNALNRTHNWLSTSVVNDCSRTVPINLQVRFLRTLKVSKSACSEARERDVGSVTQNTLAVKVSIPPLVRTASSKLVELYFKLKSLPTEPVQEKHMSSLLSAVQHLLMHLPVDMEAPPTPTSSSAKSSPLCTAGAASKLTPPPATTPLDATTSTPLSSAPPISSPPSTPGTASWVMGAKLQELVDALNEFEELGKEVFPMYFKAELVQLQKTVRDTLTFLTSGIQHETFTHEKSGCIIDSDLHPRPWRGHDLQKNPFFRRLCLDVGMRNLIQEVKRLMLQKQRDRTPLEIGSDDSDLDSIPFTPQHGVKSQTTTAGRAGGARSKVRNRKSKAPVSKSERIAKLVTQKRARKEVLHLTTPPPPRSKTSASKVSRQSSSQTITISASVTSSSPVLPLVAPTLPTATPTPHSSPQRLALCNRRISNGESFQVQVAELHSSLKSPSTTELTSSVFHSASAARPVYTTVHCSSPRASLPSTVDSAPLSSVRQAPQNSEPASGTTVTRVSYPPISSNIGNVSHAVEISRTPPPTLQSSALRSALESFVRLLHTVQLYPNERPRLQKFIATAYALTSSSAAMDLHMAQLLINQIGHQLHIAAMRTLPNWSSSSAGNSMVVNPMPVVMPLASFSSSQPLTQSSLPQQLPAQHQNAFDIHPIANIPMFTVAPLAMTRGNGSVASSSTLLTTSVACSTAQSVPYSTISLPVAEVSQRPVVNTALYTQATSSAEGITVADAMALVHTAGHPRQHQGASSGSNPAIAPAATTTTLVKQGTTTSPSAKINTAKPTITKPRAPTAVSTAIVITTKPTATEPTTTTEPIVPSVGCMPIVPTAKPTTTELPTKPNTSEQIVTSTSTTKPIVSTAKPLTAEPTTTKSTVVSTVKPKTTEPIVSTAKPLTTETMATTIKSMVVSTVKPKTTEPIVSTAKPLTTKPMATTIKSTEPMVVSTVKPKTTEPIVSTAKPLTTETMATTIKSTEPMVVSTVKPKTTDPIASISKSATEPIVTSSNSTCNKPIAKPTTTVSIAKPTTEANAKSTTSVFTTASTKPITTKPIAKPTTIANSATTAKPIVVKQAIPPTTSATSVAIAIQTTTAKSTEPIPTKSTTTTSLGATKSTKPKASSAKLTTAVTTAAIKQTPTTSTTTKRVAKPATTSKSTKIAKPDTIAKRQKKGMALAKKFSLAKPTMKASTSSQDHPCMAILLAAKSSLEKLVSTTAVTSTTSLKSQRVGAPPLSSSAPLSSVRTTTTPSKAPPVSFSAPLSSVRTTTAPSKAPPVSSSAPLSSVRTTTAPSKAPPVSSSAPLSSVRTTTTPSKAPPVSSSAPLSSVRTTTAPSKAQRVGAPPFSSSAPLSSVRTTTAPSKAPPLSSSAPLSSVRTTTAPSKAPPLSSSAPLSSVRTTTAPSKAPPLSSSAPLSSVRTTTAPSKAQRVGAPPFSSSAPLSSVRTTTAPSKAAPFSSSAPLSSVRTTTAPSKAPPFSSSAPLSSVRTTTAPSKAPPFSSSAPLSSVRTTTAPSKAPPFSSSAPLSSVRTTTAPSKAQRVGAPPLSSSAPLSSVRTTTAPSKAQRVGAPPLSSSAPLSSVRTTTAPSKAQRVGAPPLSSSAPSSVSSVHNPFTGPSTVTPVVTVGHVSAAKEVSFAANKIPATSSCSQSTITSRSSVANGSNALNLSSSTANAHSNRATATCAHISCTTFASSNSVPVFTTARSSTTTAATVCSMSITGNIMSASSYSAAPIIASTATTGMSSGHLAVPSGTDTTGEISAKDLMNSKRIKLATAPSSVFSTSTRLSSALVPTTAGVFAPRQPAMTTPVPSFCATPPSSTAVSRITATHGPFAIRLSAPNYPTPATATSVPVSRTPATGFRGPLSSVASSPRTPVTHYAITTPCHSVNTTLPHVIAKITSTAHVSTTHAPFTTALSTAHSLQHSTTRPLSSAPTSSISAPANTLPLSSTTTATTVSCRVSTAPQGSSSGTRSNLVRPTLGPAYPLPQVIPSPSAHSPPDINQVLLRELLYRSPPPVVRVQASKVFNGLLIKWTFAQEHLRWQNFVTCYDLYAFVCNKGTKIPDINLWGKVGEIKPLALPMAVTLTNFAVGQRYAFAVKVKYVKNMTSNYSKPCTIDL